MGRDRNIIINKKLKLCETPSNMTFSLYIAKIYKIKKLRN